MRWEDLSLKDQTMLILKADSDPVFFCEDKHFLGGRLWPVQKDVFIEFYINDYRELILIAGQRSSKTYMLSRFGAYELFKLLTRDYATMFNLEKGSPIFITMVAAAEKQIEDTAFFLLRAAMINSPFFGFFRPRYITDSITFETRPDIIVRALATSSVTAAGRTSKATLVDEMQGLRDTPGPGGGRNVYNILRNSVETFNTVDRDEGHVFIVGSVVSPTDMIMQLYNEGQGKKKTLTKKFATWEVNPNKPRESFAEIEQTDPLSFWRDFGAEPMSIRDVYYRDQDVIVYNGRPNLLAMLSEGLTIQASASTYILAGDPALKNEAFGIALAHLDGNDRIIDGMWRFKPEPGKIEINPFDIRDFLLKIVDVVPVRAFVSDTWFFPETQEAIKRKGILVFNHIVRKPDHDRVKELFFNKNLSVPYYEPFDAEIKSLVVLSDLKVTHPKGGTDDVVSAVTNAVWLLDQQKPTFAFNLVEVV